MLKPKDDALGPRRLIEDFGSRSEVFRRLQLPERKKDPEAFRVALEAYYATVVQSVVEHALGSEFVESCPRQAWERSLCATACLEEGEHHMPRRTACDFSLPSCYQASSALSQMQHRQELPQAVAHAPEAVDWFGPLYQDLFPRAMRHGLGEYYTPGWLAEHVLDRVGFQGQKKSRLLDPTCGSGIFLLAAIRRIREAAEKDVSSENLARHILDHVVGFDVNPLAVLTARANYLLAIRDLLAAAPLPCPAPPVLLRDVILDGSETREVFDFVVGNPPWIAWDNLPADYRERTKPLWRQYGLFSLSGKAARHGGGKKDLSMLVLYASADRYLRDRGRLGFVVTQTLFQTKGAGDGFRRFRLGEQGIPLRVLRVDDLTHVKPFAGASNWTATIALEKGRETVYPVRYVQWHEAIKQGTTDVPQGTTDVPQGATGVSPVPHDHRYGQKSPPYLQTAGHARPIDSSCPRSPWIVLPAAMQKNPSELTGPSDYTANLGANSGGANGVYWVEVIGKPSGATAGVPGSDEEVSLVLIRNLNGVGKRPVERIETLVEPDLLYPLVRWGDLHRWRAVPKTYLMLAQDVQTRSGIDDTLMRNHYPKSLDYLTQFRPLLEQRAAYRRYQSDGTFWSMYNVGPYTLTPIKVVWRRMDRRIGAAVVEPVEHFWLGRRPVVVQETCVQVAVDSTDEAHYLAAVLNSAVAGFLVAAHSVSGGKGFGTPSMLDYLKLRRFDPGDSRHRDLAELSREAHGRAAEGEDSGHVQQNIDLLAGQLWDLSQEEVAAIEEYLRTFG